MEEEKDCIVNLSIERVEEEFWVHFYGLGEHRRFGPFATLRDAAQRYSSIVEMGKQLGAEEVSFAPGTGALH